MLNVYLLYVYFSIFLFYIICSLMMMNILFYSFYFKIFFLAIETKFPWHNFDSVGIFIYSSYYYHARFFFFSRQQTTSLKSLFRIKTFSTCNEFYILRWIRFLIEHSSSQNFEEFDFFILKLTLFLRVESFRKNGNKLISWSFLKGEVIH